MSTFSGVFEEIPHISADRFDGINLKSEILFLSHCHSDHMVGIAHIQKPLYCSAISAVILKRIYPHLKQIHTLEIEEATEIEFTVQGENHKLSVTTFSARHCPGSVMFLFETNSKRILYTGDFRLQKANLEKFFPHPQNLILDAIYLDSTFFLKQYNTFPLQQESVEVICDIIRDWIKKGPLYMIQFDLPARYGSEFLLLQVSRKLGLKIHATEKNQEVYDYLPVMDDCFTKVGEGTQLHCCKFRFDSNSLECAIDGSLNKVRTIKPSALRWPGWNISKGLYERDSLENFFVPYSNHSSYSEIVDFIKHLKPKSIKLNVLPKSKKDLDVMYRDIENILSDKEKRQPRLGKLDEFTSYKFNKIGIDQSEQLDTHNEGIQLPKRIKRQTKSSQMF